MSDEFEMQMALHDLWCYVTTYNDYLTPETRADAVKAIAWLEFVIAYVGDQIFLNAILRLSAEDRRLLNAYRSQFRA